MKKLIEATRQVPCIQCHGLMGWDDTEPGTCNECKEENRVAALESELKRYQDACAGLNPEGIKGLVEAAKESLEAVLEVQNYWCSAVSKLSSALMAVKGKP